MDATLTVDTSPFSQIDRRFFAVLFASMLLHAVAATWVARQPHVVAPEETSAERPFGRVNLPPLLRVPKSFPPVKQARPPSSGGPKRSPGTGGQPPPHLGALLATAMGELDPGNGKRDIEAALTGARSGHVDTTTLAVRRDRGPDAPQAIGPITTHVPAGPVGIGEHVDAPAVKPVIEDLILEDFPPTDVTALMRFINARRPALAACYEHELKYNRSLKGRVTVQLTVAPDGRARQVEVDSGSLGSRAVAECIESVVRRWTFPVKSEDDVPLQFPVLFSPAG